MVLGTLLGLKTASLAVKLGSQGVDLPKPMLMSVCDDDIEGL